MRKVHSGLYRVLLQREAALQMVQVSLQEREII